LLPVPYPTLFRSGIRPRGGTDTNLGGVAVCGGITIGRAARSQRERGGACRDNGKNFLRHRKSHDETSFSGIVRETSCLSSQPQTRPFIPFNIDHLVYFAHVYPH